MTERYLIGADRLRREFKILERQIPFGTVVGINQTAKDIRQAQTRRIERVYDRPKAFTRSALFMRPAKTSDPEAIIGFKSVQQRYLGIYEKGGVRKHTRFERRMIATGMIAPNQFLVPTGEAKVTRGTRTQILSQVGALREGSASGSVRSRKTRRRSGSIFVARKNDRGLGLPPGIWRRKGIFIEPLFWIVDRAPRYDDRLEFERTARRVFSAKIARNLADGYRRAARPRGQ